MKTGSVPQSVSAGVQDSLSPDAPEARAIPDPPVRASRKVAAWWCIAVLAGLGAVGLSPVLIRLWDVWMDDPLRSIGMLIVPASLILTLRVWRQRGWELRGTWWGLLPLALGLLMGDSRHLFNWSLILGRMTLDFLSPKIALYLFGSGIVLLFGGTRVWRQAWFPLALLLCAQPVPGFVPVYVDLPLQTVSAHIARSFAVLIGFPPTSTDLLRLMFTPDFGMFIAPGCDGVRGALTLGYVALIVGYLKRVSIPRWISYVCGGVLLGYLFNLIRLCALVVYYRIAAGHPRLEHIAKQADYAIGGCLFLVAALLFLWMVSRKDETGYAIAESPESPAAASADGNRLFYWRAAAFALLALLFVVPGVNAIWSHRKSFAADVRDGTITAAQLDALLPKQLGGYTLNRAWQETFNGRVVVESGAYDANSADEVTLGIWMPSISHNIHECWRARGEDPEMRGAQTFFTAQGPAQFDTAFYSDGITDSIAGNAFCTPAKCIPSPRRPPLAMRFIVNPTNFETPGTRAVTIFFRIDIPHTAVPQSAVHQDLTQEAQRFLASVDFGEISRRFQ